MRRQAWYATQQIDFQSVFTAVIIDEAQNLQPIAIRMLTEMVAPTKKGKRKVVLSVDWNQAIYGTGYSWVGIHPELDLTGRSRIVDANQTIYGSGISWVSIHPDLKLQGRTRRLGINHRSTRQIIEAATGYLTGSELDRDRSAIDHRNVGPRPRAVKGLTPTTELEHILKFFTTQCGEIRRDIELCAVLVPNERSGKQFQAAFAREGLPARFMARKNIDLSFPGVKIITRHSAKGLEFPIVAISLTDSLSWTNNQDDESTELTHKKRRLNHMAMTRAMRSLLVTLPETDGDGEYSGISEPLWDIEYVR